MGLELLKNSPPWLAYLVAGIPLAGVVFKGLHLYWGVRVERFKLSSQRTERLYKLVSDESWKQASPATLTMAYGDAFHRELDDRLIRFALGRHRPLPLLRDLQRCVGMVRLAEDGLHLVRRRGFKIQRFSYRRHGQVAFLAGFIPYIALMIFGGLFPHALSPQTLARLFGGMLVWVPTTMMMANWFETAHRLIEVMDEVYPAWESLPSTITLPEIKPRVVVQSPWTPR